MFPGAIFSIVEDLAILILPIPCLSKLNVGRGKKISLISMFSVGVIACAISIIRVKPVLDYHDTLDQSWDTIQLLAWSEAELTVATICVCLPSLKPILNYHIPHHFSSSSSTGVISGSPSVKPPSSGHGDVTNSAGSENKRNLLSSHSTSKSFGASRNNSEQTSDGGEFASENTPRSDNIMMETETRGWLEKDDDLERGSSMPNMGHHISQRPPQVVEREDTTKIPIDSDGDPQMDKVQRVGRLSQATRNFSMPRSTTASRANEKHLHPTKSPDEEDYDSRCKRSLSWSGLTDQIWRLSSKRVSKFRISAFEGGTPESSLAEPQDKV
ncbi:uncharacterized protein RAG0_11097 [Rhynchosporium agropyri]|uniref:Rhodopsin domain-containing protein n=1 Tax=Rhynchosporium agropyri TaxID=914238 RepID=A0A1E1L2M9_9HELO|nr:uncharacterized protein RAG0_11097 [Rhynchosporium agropyri]